MNKKDKEVLTEVRKLLKQAMSILDKHGASMTCALEISREHFIYTTKTRLFFVEVCRTENNIVQKAIKEMEVIKAQEEAFYDKSNRH